RMLTNGAKRPGIAGRMMLASEHSDLNSLSAWPKRATQAALIRRGTAEEAMRCLDENLRAIEQGAKVDPLDGLGSSRSHRSVIHGRSALCCKDCSVHPVGHASFFRGMTDNCRRRLPHGARDWTRRIACEARP